jgi:hypothetical protein
MPYKQLTDLPEYVREALDERDQRAWMAAFNAAWDEYEGDESRAFAAANDALDIDGPAENGANAQAVGLDDEAEHGFADWQIIEHAKADGEWLPLYPFGPVQHPKHPDGEYEVDEAFYQDMKRAFDHFAAHGHYPPIQGSHAKDTDDKPRPEPHPKAWGIISDIRLNDGKIEGYHQHTRAAQALIDEGALLYRSPTHALEMQCTTCKGDDGKFKTFRHVLTEVSYVRRPQMTNLGMGSAANHYVLHQSQDDSHFITNEDVIMADENNKQNETPAEESGANEETVENMAEDTAEALASIMERLDALEEKMENMYDDGDETENGDDMEQGDQGDGDDDVEHGDSKRILQLEHRLLEMERDKTRAEVTSALGEDPDEELVEVLVGLDDEDRAKVVEHLKPEVGEGVVVSHGVQSQGSAHAEDDLDTLLEHAREEAAEDGIEDPRKFTKWLRGNDKDLYERAYRQ